MPGLTHESLRAISTQANRELANAQRKLEHAQQYHRGAMQKANVARQAYEEALDDVKRLLRKLSHDAARFGVDADPEQIEAEVERLNGGAA